MQIPVESGKADGQKSSSSPSEIERVLQLLGESLRRPQPSSYMRVLGVFKREVTHSRFIAWLLDPHESHNLGSTFLAAFLSKIEGVETRADLSDVKVKREQSATSTSLRYIDILLTSSDFLIGIENKIRAPVDLRQLIDELNGLKELSAGREAFLLLLAPRNHRNERFEELQTVKHQAEALGMRFQLIDYDLIAPILQEVSSDVEAGYRRWMFDDYVRGMKEAGIVKEFEGFDPAAEIYIKHFKEIDRTRKRFRKGQKRLLEAIVDALGSEGLIPAIEWKTKVLDEGIDVFKPDWNGEKNKGVRFHIKVDGWKLRKKSVGISLFTGKAVDRSALAETLGRYQSNNLNELATIGFSPPSAKQEIIKGKISFESGDPVRAAVHGFSLVRRLSTTIDSVAQDAWRK